jgi:two-component system, OmpR family, sensor histidine kinase BaeS
MRLGGIGGRILAASLVVVAVALFIVAVGVVRVGGDLFAALMIEAGDTAGHARAMYDDSVTAVLLLAAAVAAGVAVVLAVLFARRLARPIERLARAATQIADGDLAARVPEEGPAELRSLAAAYNIMAERLAEQETVRREFVMNASHELRTPLTNLQGYLEALRDGVIPPDPATFESLREEVDRLTRLAASLDILASGEGERPAAGPVDLAATAHASADLVAPALARRSVALTVDVDPSLAVHGRPDELTQVLANLLQNAVRYTPAGGSVRVRATRSPEGVLVEVSNSGPGIPPDDLPRVWERFYRVEKSRDRARGGAGVGLAIVKRIVEDAGGRVGATSDADWTTFWFRLPA